MEELQNDCHAVVCRLLRLDCFSVVAGLVAERRIERNPLFYRMLHLTSGVSPLLPLLFALFGFYLWSWHALAGDKILSADRCCRT